ncbi:hypothetical protein OIV19_05465 [Brucella sp. HL-2]|nr:hypothetical protein [Brucella sp. HL-2]MCV9907068.1 hypothetical protein [Brucella sp. HL-2]
MSKPYFENSNVTLYLGDCADVSASCDLIVTYDLVSDAPTREAAIDQASQQLEIGDQFQIIEARSSDAQKYEGSDFVPFLRTRNHEIVSVWGDTGSDGRQALKGGG